MSREIYRKIAHKRCCTEFDSARFKKDYQHRFAGSKVTAKIVVVLSSTRSFMEGCYISSNIAAIAKSILKYSQRHFCRTLKICSS